MQNLKLFLLIQILFINCTDQINKTCKKKSDYFYKKIYNNNNNKVLLNIDSLKKTIYEAGIKEFSNDCLLLLFAYYSSPEKDINLLVLKFNEQKIYASLYKTPSTGENVNKCFLVKEIGLLNHVKKCQIETLLNENQIWNLKNTNDLVGFPQFTGWASASIRVFASSNYNETNFTMKKSEKINFKDLEKAYNIFEGLNKILNCDLYYSYEN